MFLHYIDDKVCEGKQVNNYRYTHCPRYLSQAFKRSKGNRKCPHCTAIELSSKSSAWCGSPLNPKAKNGITQYGVVYNRCAEGRIVDGKKYTQCQFYTRQKARTVSKEEWKSAKRSLAWKGLHHTDKACIILLVIVILIVLMSTK